MEGPGGMEEADLDDFMETVTTYKCKFCAFTATTTQEMGQHARSQHIVRRTVQAPESTPKLVSLVTGATQIPGSSEASSQGQVLAQGQTIVRVPQTTSTPNAYQLIIPLPKGSTNGQAGIQTPNAGEILVTLSRPSESVKDMTASYTGQKLSGLQFISQGEDGQVFIHNPNDMQVSSNGMVQVLVQDGDGGPPKLAEIESKTSATNRNDEFQYLIKDGSAVQVQDAGCEDTTTQQMKEGQEDVKLDDAGDDTVVTKELYLCGNCSEGFGSVQECKLHMVEQHDVAEFQSASTANTGMPKVDAGTQVELKKKGGRKKKSEQAQEQIGDKPEESDKDEDVQLSESDEDWVENLHAYSTRSSRKRRPPQALKEDYYLGRRKKKEPKRNEWVGWGARCEVKGCGRRFDSEETLKKHQEFHVQDPSPGGPVFKCTSCEETFMNWKLTRYHAWKTHNIDVGLFNCSVCDFRTDAHSKLKIHSETHGSDRPYVCKQCSKGFKQFSQLKNHEYLHLGKDVLNSSEYASRWHTPKTCEICSRNFVNLKCLKKHIETVHSGQKPFKCTYCDHACSRKAMLVLHLRTHTGEKPFKCNQCQYSCSDHNSLRRHKMRHTGHKPYKCPHCPYACIQAISLKVHVKNKHPGQGGIFCCDACLFRTVNKTTYENHMKDHENGLIEVEALQVVTKNSAQRQKKSRPQAAKQLILSNIGGQPGVVQVIQPQPVVHGHQIVQLPVSTVSGQDQVAHLQVQMNENGENVISAEDYAKLTNFDGVAQNADATANLIYSALSAISLQSQDPSGEGLNPQDLLARVENGDIQTSIETNLNKEGVTTHTITFHLPNTGDLVGGVTLQEQTEEKEAVTVLQVANSDTDWQIAGADISENSAQLFTIQNS